MSAIEQTVTSLLKSTKQLLMSLTDWSVGTTTSGSVLEAYDLLSLDFNQASQAFEAAAMSMTDLASVPAQLLESLREALSQQPTALDAHLPAIRDIILQLLKGLKRKQACLRERTETEAIMPRSADRQTRAPLSPQPSVRPLPTPTNSSEQVKTFTSTHQNQNQNTSTNTNINPNPNPDTNTNTTANVNPSINSTTHNNHFNNNNNNNNNNNHNNGEDRWDALDMVKMSLFLGLGDHVKKVNFEGVVSFEGLRVLFLETFNSIDTVSMLKIRDPATLIMYELEDLEDVKPNSYLSMSLAQTQAQAQEPNSDKTISQCLTQAIQSMERAILTELRVNRGPHQIENTKSVDPEPMVSTTGAVNRIKDQQEEIQRLKRDLAVLRQVFREYKHEASKVLGDLQRAAEKLKTSQTLLFRPPRTLIDQTRQRSEEAAVELGRRLEELQDTIDELKLDVTQRKCRPSAAQLDYCKNEVRLIGERRRELAQQLQTFKPMWKKTWEEELRTIVKEQGFLKEQESVLMDMEEDHGAVVQVLEQLQKVTEIQRKHSLTQAPPLHVPLRTTDTTKVMSSVLEQVASVQVDSSRRVKALEQAEKFRARELANRIDAFEEELVTFVDSKKLKRTGGPEEIDRQRQQKNAAMLKEMFGESSRTSQ
ncbi:actin interacting protein 3-domain-containing protein [Phycomyces blakesleeanus]|uniref:Actin interacting protein 3-domain-containing protein n=2 Tax=Phycomyces blakesleeanus TaxID=4837 RepID=A0ABR3BGB7_PHYBL